MREDHTHSFFDPGNPAAYKLRTQMAEECLEQLIGWLKRGGNVGIHGECGLLRSGHWILLTCLFWPVRSDATNSSKARR